MKPFWLRVLLEKSPSFPDRQIIFSKGDCSMNLNQTFLQELEMEMANTRKTLERVPEKMDWRPHPKSMTMGNLAQHLAEIPDWVCKTIDIDDIDGPPVGAPPYQPQPAKSRREALDMFDKNLAAAKKSL